MNMKITIAAAVIAIAGATLAMSGTANAAVGVSFDFGNVALGYSDGYYDNGHRWHRWAHRGDGDHYRSMHADNYHEWRHNDRHHHDDH
jgi:hypothetical protein